MLRRVVLAGLCLGLSASSSHDACAVVLLTENAESGAGNVTTNVSSYPLIQSEIVSQGSNAFHLANPGFNDNWFALTPAVTIQADSKLFFQSRLGWATNRQFARVEASTNNGSTWPISLYNQAGTGSAGEGGFSLKQIDLSSYATQTLRFRFYYDFVTPGSAYTDVDADVGWVVDDIQIADQLAKTLYSIGNPSNDAQLYLEYINRARADAIAEGNRLAAETDSSITSAYSFFGITPANITNQFQYYVNRSASDSFRQTAQPLSFNSKLITAAELHTQDMFNNQFQGHDSSGSPPSPLVPFGGLGQRLDAVGYSGAAGENVYSYGENPREGHAAFDVDWGHVTNASSPFYNAAFNGQGMQNAAGHRINIHNAEFKEIGIGVINGTNGTVGPHLVTQDFGNPGDISFVTGVVYQDLNANSLYDLGEGRSGVRVDVDGSAYYALSSTSGGYAVPVSDDGLYNVLFSGGGFANYSTTATIASGLNVKIDYRAIAAVTYAADFNSDGRVDAADLTTWRGDFGPGNGSDANNDGDSDGADFLVWQRQLGSGVTTAAVPEPPAAMLLSGVGLAFAAGRRRCGR